MIEKNTIKSQDSLIDRNNGKRSSETLIETISKLETTIEELERTKKQLEIAIKALERVEGFSNNQDKSVQSLVNQIVSCWLASHSALKQIKELDK